MVEHTISTEELLDFRTLEVDELPEKGLQYGEGVIASAEILALNSTPKILVPSPGPGKVIEFISAILILDWESAAYATYGDLTVANETGTAYSNTVLLANLLAATADKMVQLMALDAADTGIVLLEDEALELICATGDPITGDSPVRYKIMYRVHETGL
jgi:hypothetical protein